MLNGARRLVTTTSIGQEVVAKTTGRREAILDPIILMGSVAVTLEEVATVAVPGMEAMARATTAATSMESKATTSTMETSMATRGATGDTS